jgi:hypothetical protein
VNRSSAVATISSDEPRLFGTSGRAKEFLVGNILWFGGLLMILLFVPDDRSPGGSPGPWVVLTFIPVVAGIILIERGILALHRSAGRVGWNVGLWTRLRALAPMTYRAAARESGLPPTMVVVGVYLLVGATLLAGVLRGA